MNALIGMNSVATKMSLRNVHFDKVSNCGSAISNKEHLPPSPGPLPSLDDAVAFFNYITLTSILSFVND